MSAAVVWSEALFFKKSPVLSVFALLISTAKDHRNYMSIEVSTGCQFANIDFCRCNLKFIKKSFLSEGLLVLN